MLSSVKVNATRAGSHPRLSRRGLGVPVMRIIHRHGRSRRDAAARELLDRTWPADECESIYSELGRNEAQAFAPRERIVDPYAAWLEQRESEQERTRQPIRWVYRHAAAAGAKGDGPGDEAQLVGAH
jgi:hypothetical protein